MKKIAKLLSLLLLAGAAGGSQCAWAEADLTTLSAPGEAIPVAELGDQAGGQDLTVTTGDISILNNNLNQSASVGSNLIQGVTSTGTNYVSDNAFQGSTGIVNLIQNTGNQVVIQNSMNMNIYLK